MQKKNVSVNTLLTRLILACANYDRPMKRFHMIELPASSFTHLLQAATNEKIIEAGNSACNDVPKTFMRSKSGGESTVENALNYLKLTVDHKNLFEYSQVARDGKINVALAHDFGAKGSLFLQSYLREIFDPLQPVA